MLTFSVTLHGVNEHDERNIAQFLWNALDREHQKHNGKMTAMLIGQAVYTSPVGPKQEDTATINLRTAAEIEDERLRRKGYRK